MTVWIYVDTSRDLGDAEHLKVFANEAAAEAWFRENDPEGVAFQYEVIGRGTAEPAKSAGTIGNDPALGCMSGGRTSETVSARAVPRRRWGRFFGATRLLWLAPSNDEA